jgi:hypothetical protein
MAPEPSLVPSSFDDRVLFYGLAHSLMGQLGLCWQTRLLLIDVSLTTAGRCGFPQPVAAYLARKYGYSPVASGATRATLDVILSAFEQRLRLRSQHHRYLLGEHLTALDVYMVAALGVLKPNDDELGRLQRRGHHMLVSALGELKLEIPQLLLEYREFVYREHILPLRGHDSAFSDHA